MTLALNEILMLAAGTFVLGMIGFLTRKNIILMFLSVELMLAAVAINFVAFGTFYGVQHGQLFAILILTIASCEAAIGLALVVALYKRQSTLDIGAWGRLRETEPAKSNEPMAIEEDIPPEYPSLTPAGLSPTSQSVTSRVPTEKA